MVIIYGLVALVLGGCTIGCLYGSLGFPAVLLAPFVASFAILFAAVTIPIKP
jgi:hypothetical protein